MGIYYLFYILMPFCPLGLKFKCNTSADAVHSQLSQIKAAIATPAKELLSFCYKTLVVSKTLKSF